MDICCWNKMSQKACQASMESFQLLYWKNSSLFYLQLKAKKSIRLCVFQEFIEKDPSQTEIVLQFSLNSPAMSGLMSPHFVPINNPHTYVTMYERLVQILQQQNPDLVFMLLTKVYVVNLTVSQGKLWKKFHYIYNNVFCILLTDMCLH